jgi:hypothetical protein
MTWWKTVPFPWMKSSVILGEQYATLWTRSPTAQMKNIPSIGGVSAKIRLPRGSNWQIRGTIWGGLIGCLNLNEAE